LEDVVRCLFDPAGYAVAVRGSPTDGFEDEEVEGAAEDVLVCHVALLSDFDR
jgi:hypothetical protein